MSLGTQILKKRKEMGLSQEGLAEKLGVSRQSVYKWENDQTRPELDKLNCLAKALNVKITYLLEEEESEPIKKPPKKNWLGFVLVLILFGSLFGLYNNMQKKYELLETRLDTSITHLQRQINGISSNITDTLYDYSNKFMESSYEIGEVDFENNSFKIRISVNPKTYVKGMETHFHLYADDISYDYQAIENDKSFYAEIDAPLNCSQLKIAAEFVNQDTSEFANIVTLFNPVAETWPMYDILWPINSCISEQKDSFTEQNCTVAHYQSADSYLFKDLKLPAIVSLQVFLYEDNQIVAEYQLKDTYGSQIATYFEFQRPVIKLNPTKVYSEHLIVEYEYGRQMEVISKGDNFYTNYYGNQ